MGSQCELVLATDISSFSLSLTLCSRGRTQWWDLWWNKHNIWYMNNILTYMRHGPLHHLCHHPPTGLPAWTLPAWMLPASALAQALTSVDFSIVGVKVCSVGYFGGVKWSVCDLFRTRKRLQNTFSNTIFNAILELWTLYCLTVHVNSAHTPAHAKTWSSYGRSWIINEIHWWFLWWTVCRAICSGSLW